ncbi:MAG: hypothetical protein ACPGVU_01355 [Limisphaerales bacterium]
MDEWAHDEGRQSRQDVEKQWPFNISIVTSLTLAVALIIGYPRFSETPGSGLVAMSSDQQSPDSHAVLNELRDAINAELGYLNGGPTINQGPCANFASIFCQEWNSRFENKPSLLLVSQGRSRPYHVLILLPDGHAFDGGHGILSLPMVYTLADGDQVFETRQFDLLERYFGGADRRFPRSPAYDPDRMRELVGRFLDRLALPRSS